MFLTPWVKRILLATTIVFLVTYSLRTIPGFLVLVPALVWKTPWTPFTYMFVHVGFGHIFFNMLTLFFFGPRVEQHMGGRRFIQLYLISGLSGAALSIFTPFVAIVGASGAVFGVMFAFAYYFPRAQILLWFVVPIPARVLVGVWIAFAVLGGLGVGGEGVANFAHLGGVIGAFLFLKFGEHYSPAARFKRRAQPGLKPLPFVDPRDRWKKIDGDEMHPLNREELNRILDKISASGIASLNAKERTFLDRFSATH
jgi:rhomboid family protein